MTGQDAKCHLFHPVSPARPAAYAAMLCLVIVIAVCRFAVWSHSGPPYPIIEDRIVGPYQIALWADPDTTDDQSAAGKFWITLRLAPSHVEGQIPSASRDAECYSNRSASIGSSRAAWRAG